MKKGIKDIRKTKGNYSLKKTRQNEPYIITGEDIKELAMLQEGNKILDILDELTVILRGKEIAEPER